MVLFPAIYKYHETKIQAKLETEQKQKQKQELMHNKNKIIENDFDFDCIESETSANNNNNSNELGNYNDNNNNKIICSNIVEDTFGSSFSFVNLNKKLNRKNFTSKSLVNLRYIDTYKNIHKIHT